MAEYRTVHGSLGPVLVEVDSGGGGGTGGSSLPDALAVIGSVAAACSDAVARVPERKRPGTVEVRFGLRALQDGSLAVGLDPGHASFEVRLTWSSSGGGSAGDLVSDLLE